MIAVTECRAHGLTPIIPVLDRCFKPRPVWSAFSFYRRHPCGTKRRSFYDFTGQTARSSPGTARAWAISPTAVWSLTGGKIVEEGATADLKARYPQAEFVDARGGVIMPGLINAHTHIYSALARGLSIDGYDPTSFYEVLDGQWWYIDRNLDLGGHAGQRPGPGDRLHQAGRHHHLRPPRQLLRDPRSLMKIAEVTKEYGMRACLCYEVSDGTGRRSLSSPFRRTRTSSTTASATPATC